jgi:hypothetical protein
MNVSLYGPEDSLLGASYPGPHESNLYLYGIIRILDPEEESTTNRQTSETIYPTTPCNIPEDINLHKRLP